MINMLTGCGDTHLRPLRSSNQLKTNFSIPDLWGNRPSASLQGSDTADATAQNYLGNADSMGSADSGAMLNLEQC
jgi:hypothetical protein